MSDLDTLRNMLVCGQFEAKRAEAHIRNLKGYLNDLEERIDALEHAQNEDSEPRGLHASRHSVYALRGSLGCFYRLRDGCWQVRLPGSTEWLQSEHESKQAMLDKGFLFDAAELEKVS